MPPSPASLLSSIIPSTTLLVGLALAPGAAAADDAITDTLARHGLHPALTYTVDVMGNPSAGGVERGVRALDHLALVVDVDGGPLVGLAGTSGRLYLHHNRGGAPDADLLRSAQGVDNIEIGDDDTILYEAWLQQRVGAVSLRAGLYDLNSEFYVDEPAGLFLHPSYGIGPELAQTGPSIFPRTSLAARLRVEPHPSAYLQAAVIDPVRDLAFDGGALLIAEAGFTPARTKLAAGAWRYTELAGTMATPNQGGYLLVERSLHAIDLFARAGLAAPRANRLDASWSAGLVVTGLVPGRADGTLGLAIAGAHNGAPFRAAAMAAGAPVDTTETELELTYQDAVTPWLSVQVDGQYVHHPGTDPAVADALLLASRVSCSF